MRTARVRAGARLTTVSLVLQRSLGVAATILPMADEPVRTEVHTDDGWLEFQEWFVHRHQEPAVDEIRLRGIEAATVTPEVRAALAHADLIVICPSNPIVSIGPILAVPGLRDEIAAARRRGVAVAAVSPIVAGHALKGPADRMLASLGHESSATGVARIYAGLIDWFVVDDADAALEPEIAALGIAPVVTATVMTDDDSRATLARRILELRALPGRGGSTAGGAAAGPAAGAAARNAAGRPA